jgi:hypothetical protein
MQKDILYSTTCLAFAIIIGGAVYEHLNVVPQWAAAPPASLSMFQGKYGLKPALFWIIIHPVTLGLFALTLIVHWHSPRRKNLLIVLTTYLAILLVTAFYFVPELVAITTTAYTQTTDVVLTQRAAAWEILSLLRLVVLVGLSLFLFTGLTKGNPILKMEMV